jgi:hypothetical protein
LFILFESFEVFVTKQHLLVCIGYKWIIIIITCTRQVLPDAAEAALVALMAAGDVTSDDREREWGGE